jgi:hypothetical protein
MQFSLKDHARTNAKALARWNHTPTRAIRVPEVFVEELLAIARAMDNASASSEPSIHLSAEETRSP